MYPQLVERIKEEGMQIIDDSRHDLESLWLRESDTVLSSFYLSVAAAADNDELLSNSEVR